MLSGNIGFPRSLIAMTGGFEPESLNEDALSR
jgi:hypothetical protein